MKPQTTKAAMITSGARANRGICVWYGVRNAAPRHPDGCGMDRHGGRLISADVLARFRDGRGCDARGVHGASISTDSGTPQAARRRERAHSRRRHRRVVGSVARVGRRIRVRVSPRAVSHARQARRADGKSEQRPISRLLARLSAGARVQIGVAIGRRRADAPMIAAIVTALLAVAAGLPFTRRIGEAYLLGIGIQAAMLIVLPWSRPVLI